jgi:probable lipoprotein NlpC
MNRNTLIIISFLAFFLTIVPGHEVLGQGRKKQKKITKATSHAKSFIGTPYQYGGNSRNGIDCSSLIQQSYAKIGIKLPRTAQEQAKVGNKKGEGVHASSSRGVVEDTYNDYYKKHTKYFRRVIK